MFPTLSGHRAPIRFGEWVGAPVAYEHDVVVDRGNIRKLVREVADQALCRGRSAASVLKGLSLYCAVENKAGLFRTWAA